jgi:ribosomal protein S18 acetylase RimI-like enzyme
LTVHFYRYDSGSRPAEGAELPSNLCIRCWRADVDGFPPRGSRIIANLLWWALAKLRLFARPGFTEIALVDDGCVVHRLIVTPGWYRFPFMSPHDLQLGALWTSPDSRRRHLARAAIAEAHRRFAHEDARFWYVTDADNRASAALARSCGYRLVATGERTRRFGSSLLGQYVIERPA